MRRDLDMDTVQYFAIKLNRTIRIFSEVNIPLGRFWGENGEFYPTEYFDNNPDTKIAQITIEE